MPRFTLAGDDRAEWLQDAVGSKSNGWYIGSRALDVIAMPWSFVPVRIVDARPCYTRPAIGNRDDPSSRLEVCVALVWNRIEFECRAADGVRLDASLLPVFRGRIGFALKSLGCVATPPCAEGAEGAACQAPHSCPYACLFESPTPPGSPVLSGRSNQPHPLVIGLDPAPDGSRATLTASIVGWPRHFHPLVIVAIQEAFRLRPRFLRGDPPAIAQDWRFDRLDESFATRGATTPTARLELVTPLRLTDQGAVRGAFEPGVFFARLLERLDALETFWGGDGPEPVETRRFRDLRPLVDAVSVEDVIVERVASGRRSSRQEGREVHLDGLIGWVRLAGIAPELWPALRLGEVLHVGRSVSAGCGRYRIEVL